MYTKRLCVHTRSLEDAGETAGERENGKGEGEAKPRPKHAQQEAKEAKKAKGKHAQ